MVLPPRGIFLNMGHGYFFSVFTQGLINHDIKERREQGDQEGGGDRAAEHAGADGPLRP